MNTSLDKHIVFPDMDLLAIIHLLIGNSFDYLLLFLPLYILYTIYSKYNERIRLCKYFIEFTASE